MEEGDWTNERMNEMKKIEYERKRTDLDLM